MLASKLKPNKCNLFTKSVSFVGHFISDEDVATDPEKVEAVREWPAPVNETEKRSFLGLYGYYGAFIKRDAEIAIPLHVMTEKDRPFI